MLLFLLFLGPWVMTGVVVMGSDTVGGGDGGWAEGVVVAAV